jgi:hypothetical protein
LGRLPAQTRGLPARAPPLSAHLRPASARAPARPALSLPLTGKAAPPVSRSLSRARSLPLAVWPRLSATSSSSRRPFTAVTSGHRLRPLLRLLAAQGSLAPLRPPLPLTSVLAGTAPPWCPLGGAVRHLWADCVAHRSRGAPPPPFPRAPIKGSPRAPSSPHQPRPSLSSLVRARIRGAPPSSPSPVSPPLFPLPLRWSSEKLSEPSSSLTRPRTRSTTSQPPSPTQSPPAAIPAAELRPLPVGSPLPTPSGRIEPTLRIASLCPC